MRDIDALAGAICANRPPEVAEGLPLHVDDECLALAGRVIAALHGSGFAIVDQEAALRAGGSLDEAWAEAEAALPEGWSIWWLHHRKQAWEAVAGWDGATNPVEALVESAEDEPTPAAALRALAAALRGPQATEPTGSASSIDLREGET